jgi:VanZ family protein
VKPSGPSTSASPAGGGLKVWRVLLAFTLLAILVLSLMPPSSKLPTTGWDKSNHMLGFGTLGLLGVRGWPGRAWIVLAALLAYGALIEVLQSLTPYRSAEWADLIADGVGLLVGLVVARASLLIQQRRNKD